MKMAKQERLFSSTEVVAMTGITYRQLQFWDERGHVKPKNHTHRERFMFGGYRRLYTREQIDLIGYIAVVTRHGHLQVGAAIEKAKELKRRGLDRRMVEQVFRVVNS